MNKNKTKIKIILTLSLSLACLGIFTNFTQAADIDVTASRTSGVAPLSVFFNADLTASSETERSFHDYYYSWNFGDPDAGNWGTDGKSKNTDTGPVAAHIFETPGTYDVTLTVIDPADNSHITALEETFTITVTDPDVVFSGTNTICISDVASNDFTGCPSEAQHIATDSLANIKTWVTSNHRVLLRRSSVWIVNYQLLDSTSITGARLGAYGTCDSSDENSICTNAPQINLTDSTVSLFSLYNKNDFVIQDLNFVSEKAALSKVILGGGANISQVTFFRNKIRGFGDGVNWFHGQRTEENQTYPINMAVIACDIRDFYAYAIFGGGENVSIMGNQVHNSDTTHITRLWWAYKGVYSHNMVSGSSLTNTQARADLKLHGPKSTDSQAIDLFPSKIKEVGTFAETGSSGLPYSTQYVVVSNNIFGSSGSRPVDILPQDTDSDERIYDVIFERNKLIQSYGEHSSIPWLKAFHILGYYITARNNVFDASYADDNLNGLTQIQLDNYTFMPTPTGTHVYNNTIYDEGDNLVNGVTGVFVDAGITNAVIRNNYMSFPDATYTKTIIDDQSGTAIMSNNVMTDTPYFTDPNNASPLLRNFSLTSSAVQAIDLGTTVPVYDDFAGNRRIGAYDIGAFEYQLIIRGDVDNNSSTNTTDALLTLRNSLGLSMASTAWQDTTTTGDVDCNGVSNSTDALLILRYSIGLNMINTSWCE